MKITNNLNRFVLSCDPQSAFGSIVQRWTGRDVVNWLQGLDDSLSPYLEIFLDKKVDGSVLSSLTDGDLQDLGVDSVGARKLLLKSLSVLFGLCFDAETENLQTLISSVSIQARNLYNELKRHSAYQKINAQSNCGYLPNVFLCQISHLAEKTKKLMSWFDRPPFVDDERYADLRNSILTMTLDILDLSVNKILSKLDDKQLVTNLQISCTQLFTTCDRIIEENIDPLLLQTAYFERCVINRRSLNEELGLHVESTPDGVHVITEVKFQTPADLCRKIDVGDEIIEINGQSVVGWSQEKMVAYLTSFSLTATRLTLLLKKRPRETWNIYKTTPSTPRLRKATVVIANNNDISNKTAARGRKSKNHSCASTSTVATNGSSASSSVSNQTAVLQHGGHRRRSSSFTATHNNSVVSSSFDQPPPEKISSRNRRSRRHARKWKSTKSPTCPLSALVKPKNAAADLMTSETRNRRATVSGGSPTLKRLSLHINRKCSLMPNNQVLNDPKKSVLNRTDKEKLNKIYLDTIYGEHSTSSANSGDFLDDRTEESATESEDDVFVVDTDKISDKPLSSSTTSSSGKKTIGDCGKTFSGKSSFNPSILEEDLEFAEILPVSTNDNGELEKLINSLSAVVPADKDNAGGDDEWNTAKKDSQERKAPFLSISDSQVSEDSHATKPVDLSASSYNSNIRSRHENDQDQQARPPSIDVSSDDLGLRGVVDQEGPIAFPGTLPLRDTQSRRKIEAFFGENLSESLNKIYNSDDVSSTSSGDGSPSRMSTSLPNRNKGWPPRPLWKKWSNSRLADFLMNRSTQSDVVAAGLPPDESADNNSRGGGAGSVSTNRTPRSARRPAYPIKSGQSLNSLDTAAEYLMNNIDLYELCCTPCSNLLTKHQQQLLISNKDESMTSSSDADANMTSSLLTVPDSSTTPTNQIREDSSLLFNASWIRRYRLSCEKSNMKWLKRYAVLADRILYVYVKPTDYQAEGVICLKNCKVCPISSDYRTSKKNVFQIHCCDVTFSFYYSQKKDMVEWLNKLGLAAIGFGTKPEACKKPDENTGYYFPAISVAYRSMANKKSSHSNPSLYATSPRYVSGTGKMSGTTSSSDLLLKSLKNRYANSAANRQSVLLPTSNSSRTSRRNSTTDKDAAAATSSATMEMVQK